MFSPVSVQNAVESWAHVAASLGWDPQTPVPPTQGTTTLHPAVMPHQPRSQVTWVLPLLCPFSCVTLGKSLPFLGISSVLSYVK